MPGQAKIEKSILAVDHFEVMPPSYGVQGGVIHT